MEPVVGRYGVASGGCPATVSITLFQRPTALDTLHPLKGGASLIGLAICWKYQYAKLLTYCAVVTNPPPTAGRKDSIRIQKRRSTDLDKIFIYFFAFIHHLKRSLKMK